MSDRNLGEDNLKAESAAIVSTLFCSFFNFFSTFICFYQTFPFFMTGKGLFGSWITYGPCTNLRCVMNFGGFGRECVVGRS